MIKSVQKFKTDSDLGIFPSAGLFEPVKPFVVAQCPLFTVHLCKVYSLCKAHSVRTQNKSADVQKAHHRLPIEKFTRHKWHCGRFVYNYTKRINAKSSAAEIVHHFQQCSHHNANHRTMDCCKVFMLEIVRF